MIGMILCGGYSSENSKPGSKEIPKPLRPLKGNYTILDKQLNDMIYANAMMEKHLQDMIHEHQRMDWQLENATINKQRGDMEKNKIKKIILLVGHLSETIKDRYGYNYNGIRIEYSYEEEPLGTLNAINHAVKSLDDNDLVLVRNGDVISDINLIKMMKKYDFATYSAMMFITKMRSPYGVVEVENDYVNSFREKPDLDYNINGGIYIFDRRIPFGDFDKGDIEKTILPLLANTHQLGYYSEDSLWMSIDSTRDLEALRREYENRKDKPWGYEKTLVKTERHVTREIYMKEGFQTSWHYHDQEEVLYVLRGECFVQKENDKREFFEKNDMIRIDKQEPHAIVALAPSIMHSISGPDEEDIIRINDFYQRDKLNC